MGNSDFLSGRNNLLTKMLSCVGNENNKMNKKNYCVPPLPVFALFAGSLTGLAIITGLILFGFLLFRIVHSIKIINNRITLDSKSWGYVSWCLALVVYVIISGPYLFFDKYYGVSFFILAILILANLIIGKKFNLYKIKFTYWLLATVFLIFATVVFFININKSYGDIKPFECPPGGLCNPLGSPCEQTWF